MPLFECSKCKCAENTALSGYWNRYLESGIPPPALCSECEPAIGKWHGEFAKRPAIEVYDANPDAWGGLTKPEGAKREN